MKTFRTGLELQMIETLIDYLHRKNFSDQFQPDKKIA